MIRTTAFACRYKNKLALLTSECVIVATSRLVLLDFWFSAKPDIRQFKWTTCHDELGSPVALFVFVAIVGWAFQKPIGFTLVVIGQLAQIPLRRAVPFALRIKQPCQFQ
jgi:hypothetical protein